MLPPRHPVAFELPQTVDALRVSAEALPALEAPYPAVAVAGVPAHQHLHAGEKPGLVARDTGLVVPDDAGYQYKEDEYMLAEEYDHLIAAPTDYLLQVYLPRICGAY
ncbi:MAG: hypothetical protein ACYC33_12080 [Thermoleophilia bacterium]